MLSVMLQSLLMILLSILSVIGHVICGINLNWLLNLNLIYKTRWVGLFLRKNHLLRCWGWPSLLNWIGAHTLSLLLKLPPRKLKHSTKFLSPEFSLYLYKFVICPCMEYHCHIWAGAPRCYLELLVKLQKWICWSVGPSLAAPLESLVRCLNVAGLSLL